MSAMTNTNWPDSTRPGVPMFPERDGWHVIDTRSGGNTVLAYWNGNEWAAGDCVRGLNSSPEWWRYNGPVLTPTQINEMLAAERQWCADACRAMSCDAHYTKTQRDALEEAETVIRNLGAAP